MKVLVTGAAGQVGRALLRCVPPEAIAIGLTREQCDISDCVAVATQIRAIQPDVIINAAAYTAVDRAESNPVEAERVNVEGVRILAAAAASCAARFVHISTDFVFDGAASRPYGVDAVPAPLSVYGRTKLEGENAARGITAARTAILRTAWVYDAAGRNFLTTMLGLMRERGRVAVVADQIGTPTAASSVAEALWRIATQSDAVGIFHWTDAGVATWYDFAVAIAEEAAVIALLPAGIEVTPIATTDYPTPARRPAYSVLDTRSTTAALGLEPIHWRYRLRTVLGELNRA